MSSSGGHGPPPKPQRTATAPSLSPSTITTTNSPGTSGATKPPPAPASASTTLRASSRLANSTTTTNGTPPTSTNRRTTSASHIGAAANSSAPITTSNGTTTNTAHTNAGTSSHTSSTTVSDATLSYVGDALTRVGFVAVVELCVALHKFVNIELHSQGWYAVRVKVNAGPHAVCVPHTVVHGPGATGAAAGASSTNGGNGGGAGTVGAAAAAGGGADRGSGGDRTSGSGMAGGLGFGGNTESAAAACKRSGWVVDEAGCWFRTSVFRIRYCYEEVKLQSCFMCRLFVADLRHLASLSVTLDFELLFQEASTDCPGPPTSDMEFNLKAVARESVVLTGVGAGAWSYCGCTFSDEHFALCAAGLFSCLAGYATREVTEGLQPAPSSWLCHLVGDGRRAGGNADPLHRLLAGGGGGASGGDSPGGSSSGGCLYRVARSRAGELDFGDQELRKRVIKALHGVVEAPTIKHGAPSVASERDRQERLLACHALLLAPHAAARDALAARLRAAPPDCFAPQNLDVLRKLLSQPTTATAGPAGPAASSTPGVPVGGGGFGGGATSLAAPASPARDHSALTSSNNLRNATPRASAAAPLSRLSVNAHTPTGAGAAVAAGGEGTASTAGGTAAAGMVPRVRVPSLSEFRRLLVRQPTTGAALGALDELLTGLSRDVRTDWGVLCWVVRVGPRELMRHVKEAWEAEQPDAVMPFLVFEDSIAREAVTARAAAHRSLLRLQDHPLPTLRPAGLWGAPGEQPVLVVDDSQGIKWLAEVDTYFGGSFRPRDEVHVAIFVHGFQGAATDLCLVKAHLMLMFPYLECYCSKTNEGNTHDSLQEMGRRLAAEMAEFLAPFSRAARRPLRKITLVGHSIGNLILRAALTQPEFEPYKHLLWMYLSVSGPHLGFLYGSNAVVDTGMVLLKSVGKGRCLHQLTFSDAPQLQDCYLYRLAHESPLSVFKLVLVVASPQDRYVPYHSAAVMSCPQAERDSRRGRAYATMLRALTCGVGQGTHLFRCAVDFSLRAKGFSLSRLVGRTAHIEFIESGAYVGLLAWGLLHRYRMMAPASHGWL